MRDVKSKALKSGKAKIGNAEALKNNKSNKSNKSSKSKSI